MKRMILSVWLENGNKLLFGKAASFRHGLRIIAIVDKFCSFVHIPKKTLLLQGGMIES